MKRPKNIEDQLREKMPPMRNKFRSKLRVQLFEKAEQKFKRSSSFISFFTHLLNHMKKHSLGYISLVLITALGINTIFQNPLSPEEVLANAMENYEATGDIYHQKIAYYSYDDGQLINSNIQEIYDDGTGNSLSFNKDIHTEEILSRYLYTIDKFGDIMIYQDSEPSEDRVTSEYKISQGQDWFDKFKGEKIYCIKSQNLEDKQAARAFLTLAADDFHTYLLNGFIDDTDFKELEMILSDSDKLQDLQTLEKDKILTKDYINVLMKNEAYDYSQIEEDGKDYHLFKMDNGQVWFFIDAETYELSKYEYHYNSDPNIYEKYIVLENEFLNNNDYPNLFDPSQYQGLFASPQAPHHPPYAYSEFNEDGCYDWQMNKLNDSILDEIPNNITSEWQNKLKELIIPSEPIELEPSAIPAEIDPSELPTQAPLTQGYHPLAHKAWDLAPEEGGDDSVYLPKDGVVELVADDGYNGGYGKFLLISHQINGEKVLTRYANLDEIYVKEGQPLKAHEVIAKIGSTGLSTGKHLHFEVIINGDPVDPALLWQ